MKKLTIMIVIVVVVGMLSAQHPVWDRTVSTEVTDSRIGKSINLGSLHVDELNQVYGVFLQSRPDAGAQDRHLYFLWRDYDNNWSRPERIEAAGSRFRTPNVIVNPVNGEVEIYGELEGALHVLTRDEDDNWELDRIDTGEANILSINVTVDGNGNIHIAGVTEVGENINRIIYVHNLEEEWEHIIVEDSEPHNSPFIVRPAICTTEEGRVVVGYVGRQRIRVLQNRAAGHDVWRSDALHTPMEADLSFGLDLLDDEIHLVTSGQDMWGSPWIMHYFNRHIHDDEWPDPVQMFEQRSINNPTVAVDSEQKVHVVGTEVSGNLFTGELRYITNATEDDDWELANPFDEHNWDIPFMTLDLAGEFQLLKVRSDRINGDFEHELVHRGARWQYILPTPESLAAEADTTFIRLSWDETNIPDHLPLPDFLGYNMYRRIDEEGDFEILNEEIITDTSYVDIDLEPGFYEYYVTAVFAEDQESEKSETVSAQIKSRLQKPVFYPEPGKYKNEVKISIKSPDGVGEIYYTVDGSEPDEDSYRFTDELLVEETVLFKAIVINPDYYPSEVATAKYEIIHTSVEEYPAIGETEIISAAPNPFNPETNIFFRISEPSTVSLDVYNSRGQYISNLLNDDLDTGEYSVVWNGTDDYRQRQASGVYYIRLSTEKHSLIKGILLLK